MIRLLETDQDNLLSSILTLSRQKAFGEAKTLIKVAIESTLTGTAFSSLSEQIRSIVPSSKPFEPDYVLKFKDLDKQLKKTLSSQRILLEDLQKDQKALLQELQAKVELIDYLEVSSKILDDDHEGLRKKLLASLITIEKPSNGGLVIAAEGYAEMLSPKDASEILGVSDQTIRRMCEKGKFPGAQKTNGGHWKIPAKHFKISKAQAMQIDRDIQDIRTKALEGGEVDEFDVIE